MCKSLKISIYVNNLFHPTVMYHAHYFVCASVSNQPLVIVRCFVIATLSK